MTSGHGGNVRRMRSIAHGLTYRTLPRGPVAQGKLSYKKRRGTDVVYGFFCSCAAFWRHPLSVSVRVLSLVRVRELLFAFTSLFGRFVHLSGSGRSTVARARTNERTTVRSAWRRFIRRRRLWSFVWPFCNLFSQSVISFSPATRTRGQ